MEGRGSRTFTVMAGSWFMPVVAIPLIAAHIGLFAIGMVALALIPATVALVRHMIQSRHARALSAAAVVPAPRGGVVS